MADVTEKFLILKKTKYAESDLIIHALSTKGTKKSFLAKGALRSKKRFGGGILEPTHFVEFTYKESRTESGLNYLNEAIMIDDFKNIRTDFGRIEFALQIMKCAYHVAQEGDADSHFLFNLVGHGLRFLNSSKPEELLTFKLHFYLKFLFQQGVISIDPWMSVFLKTNLAESGLVHIQQETEIIVDTYLDSIELQVFHYIKSADSGF
jgi:DNA repair protein RecO (recombination protein O)